MTLVTDTAGITARMTPLFDVKPGDHITQGWKPWPVVAHVERSGGEARMIFADGHAGQWLPHDTPVPVLVP